MAKAMRIEIATVNPQSGNWLYAGLDLPAEEYEIRDAFQRARMASGGTYREYSINECEALPLLVGQRLDSPTVRELNFLAQRLESLGNEERLVLQAVASKYIGREEDVVVSVKDLINLTYGLDEVMVASNVKDVGELGRFVIENDMNELFENIPTDVLPYLDKSKIGQMQQQIDGGVFLNNQYVVAGAYELREVYNGREFPDENLHARYTFRLEVSSPPDNDDDLDDAIQSAHWLTLPVDKGKANEVARECGQVRIEDCVYFGFESTIPQINSDNFGDMQDFDKLNQLAELLLEMTPADQAKFKAVLSAEESSNLADILDVAKNLHQYEFAPQVEDAAHFFKSYLERHLDTRFDTKWLDGVLLRDEGYELLGRLGGTLTDYGAISARCRSLYECVPYDKPKVNPLNDERFELIEINGKTALFTNERIQTQDVPEGLYKYDVRGGDTNDFVTIEPCVTVNHSGTVLIKEPFDFNGKDYISLNDESSPNFLGEKCTVTEFMDTDYEQEQATLKLRGE